MKKKKKIYKNDVPHVNIILLKKLLILRNLSQVFLFLRFKSEDGREVEEFFDVKAIKVHLSAFFSSLLCSLLCGTGGFKLCWKFYFVLGGGGNDAT